MKTALIGTGNMGKALLRGFIGGKVVEPSDVYVFDLSKEAMDRTAVDLKVNTTSSANEAVKDADYVVLCVKPQHFDDVVRGLKDSLKDDVVVISIAAAVKVSRIQGLLGEGKKFVRIMPNTPAQVGAGISALCPVGLSEDETDFVKKLFDTCGETVICDEKTLDAIGCVSGTGPAYVMLFIEAMADAAVSLGIRRDIALKVAAGTVMGSGKLALDTGIHPAVLKDQVCSPGGTTIAGVMALEENGLRNAVIKSVIAASDKTKELSGN